MVLAARVDKGSDVLSDTATLTLPGMAGSAAQAVEQKLPEGTPIACSLGYDGDNKPELQDYVKALASRDNQVIVHCEDAMYLLRRRLPNR